MWCHLGVDVYATRICNRLLRSGTGIRGPADGDSDLVALPVDDIVTDKCDIGRRSIDKNEVVDISTMYSRQRNRKQVTAGYSRLQ